MRGQRRMAGLVLVATLTTALWAAPSQAWRFGPERASPAVVAESPNREADATWVVRVWSWWTALFAADNGCITP